MKNIFISFTIVFSLLITISCSSTKHTQTEKIYLPISKSLIGFWRQTATFIKDGKKVDFSTPYYKSINTDGTYYTFKAEGNGNTKIIQYGSYEITTDSTYTEHVVVNRYAPLFNNRDSYIKFNLVDENTLIMAWSLDQQKWNSEKWTRVPLLD